jgi:medium-chain acyl-[acyl-carrier-protein] hydrolase
MSLQRANPLWIDDTSASAPAPRIRLFCLPYAGGGSAIFRSWQPDVLDGIQVCGVHLPGRGDRFNEAPFTRLDPLVAAIADNLRPLLDVPFALFGHCMGALIAFELARMLGREGHEPVHLTVSALPPPRLVEHVPALHDLPAGEFVSALAALNGLPDDLLNSPDFLDLMLPTLRADFEVCETYVYRAGPPLRCSISAYAGRRDPRCPNDLIASWRSETSGRFMSRLFPGDHFFIDSARVSVLSALSVDLLGTLFAERSSA